MVISWTHISCRKILSMQISLDPTQSWFSSFILIIWGTWYLFHHKLSRNYSSASWVVPWLSILLPISKPSTIWLYNCCHFELIHKAIKTAYCLFLSLTDVTKFQAKFSDIYLVNLIQEITFKQAIVKSGLAYALRILNLHHNFLFLLRGQIWWTKKVKFSSHTCW